MGTITLKFDGTSVTAYDNGSAVKSWYAISGNILMGGLEFLNPKNTNQPKMGPLPEGNYTVDPSKKQNLSDDLNGNGAHASRLGYGGGTMSSTYFDMDNDGFAERTAWASSGDGLLVMDKNGNGKIDNQSAIWPYTCSNNNAEFAKSQAA